MEKFKRNYKKDVRYPKDVVRIVNMAKLLSGIMYAKIEDVVEAMKDEDKIDVLEVYNNFTWSRRKYNKMEEILGPKTCLLKSDLENILEAAGVVFRIANELMTYCETKVVNEDFRVPDRIMDGIEESTRRFEIVSNSCHYILKNNLLGR